MPEVGWKGADGCCCAVKVVKQCVETEGVQPDYVRREILPEFFRSFWVRRMALDRRNYRALVETTVALANKVCAPPAGANPHLAAFLTRHDVPCPYHLR